MVRTAGLISAELLVAEDAPAMGHSSFARQSRQEDSILSEGSPVGSKRLHFSAFTWPAVKQ